MRRESGAIWRALLPWVLALAAPVAVAASQQAGTHAGSTPDVRSAQFYVLDPADSSVLAARDEDKAAPIASITKLMTALVVLEAGQPMDEKLGITSAEIRGTAGAGSRLPKGAMLSRADMLHLALMSSENRAAHSLCRNYPGGMKACVKAMNEKAAELGMTSARFVEPTGLSKDNVASPADLAKLVLAAGGNETVRKYSTDPDHTVYLNRRPLEFRNTNLLVKQSDWDVAVQKTGYISEAGRCLVMETVIDGRDIVIVLLNSWGTLTRIADAKRIRRWMESSLAASTS
jgi:D-alanyl-D-alanine endopeptidase (penicillin-binding protein 7)